MAKPSDREFELRRRIKDLEETNGRLEDQVVKLKRSLAKITNSESTEGRKKTKKIATSIQKPCPDCGAEIKSMDLPHSILDLCSKMCGHRNVRSKK
jgi:hypothetical protein